MNAMLEQPPLETLPRTESSWTVRTETLTTDFGAEFFDEWRTLFDQDAAAYSLQHPDFVLAECAHLAKSRLTPLLVQCRRGDELAGVALLLPKSVSTGKAGGVGPGWMLTGYRLAGGRWLNAGASHEVDHRLFAAALEAVRAQRADFLMIEDLDHASPLWSRLQDDLPARWSWFAPQGCQPRLRIQFPEDENTYWDQFSKRTLSGFRRKMKKLGEARLERIAAADQVPAFLAAAHQISVQTWQTRHLGLRVRNNDAERETMSALANAGLLRSYLLRVQGEPAAFCVGNQAHGVFHYEEVGYATKFAQFSPGQILVVQIIEDLLAHDRADWFDFGGGDAGYKQQFANHISTSGTVWLTPPSLKAQASLRWIQTGRGARQMVRRMVTGLGLATRARQWIRYGGWRPAVAETANEEPMT